MHESGKRILRRGAALLLSVFLCAGVAALAADGERLLVPVGHTVGVKLFARGVVVVKPPEADSPAEACGLCAGDVILRCDGAAVTSSEQFQSLLQSAGAEETDLRIRRDGRELTLSVSPEKNEEGVRCIGAWIRDSMAGIGTVTYLDPASGAFGALGHGIADVDTALLMPFSNGSILPSTVKAVKKGEAGSAGELKGDFDLTQDLGPLRANTDSGIFGILKDPDSLPRLMEAVPTGMAEAGPAMILSNIQGDTVDAYEIEIMKVSQRAADGRELVISVTDPALLAATGGIVQGMSGSPILQNGKLVGAVTHVLLNDPTKGYGILIETMLKASETAG